MSDLQPVSFRKPHVREPVKPKKQAAETWLPWTAEEDAVILEKYPAGGMIGCDAHLPNRTPGAIQQRAMKLGLKYVGTKKYAGRAVDWTPPANIEETVRQRYPTLNGKKRGEMAALADELQVPRWWLSGLARRLGLAMPHKKEPPWTAPELLLLQSVPLHDVDKCAEIFRENGFARSPMSIRVKSTRVGLSRRYSATFSATAISRILGVDSKTVTREIIAGDMKAEKRKTQRLAQQGGDPWSVTRADLRTYIVEHLERIDLRKVEKFEFVDVLVRVEQ